MVPRPLTRAIRLAAALATGAATTLSAPDPADATITYEQRGAIYVAEADGGNAVRIASGRGPFISPDGNTVVFSPTGRNLAFVRGAGQPTRPIKIGRFKGVSTARNIAMNAGATRALVTSSKGTALFSLAGGSPRILQKRSSDFGSFAPSGNRVVFSSGLAHVSEWVTTTLTGRRLGRFAWGFLARPIWTPLGIVAYRNDNGRTASEVNLYTQRGTLVRVLRQLSFSDEAEDQWDMTPISATADRVVVLESARGPDSRSRLVQIEPRTARVATSREFALSDYNIAAVSSDGTRIYELDDGILTAHAADTGATRVIATGIGSVKSN